MHFHLLLKLFFNQHLASHSRIHQILQNTHKLSFKFFILFSHSSTVFKFKKLTFTQRLSMSSSRNIFHHTQLFLENSFPPHLSIPLLCHCRFCLPFMQHFLFSSLLSQFLFCLCGLIMCLRMVHFRISTLAIHFSSPLSPFNSYDEALSSALYV